MDLDEAMRTTFSAREFTADPLPDAALADILDRARFAPSGGNRQGWKVIVVRDNATREALARLTEPAAKRYIAQQKNGENPWNTIDPPRVDAATIERTEPLMRLIEPVLKAPVVLVICVDLKVVASTDQHLDRVGVISGASIYPFAWNILLAARARGFAGTITTLAVAQEPKLKQLLGLPSHVAVAGAARRSRDTLARMAPLQITPVHPVLGARVEGVDLTAAVDDATFRKIHDAFQEYSVLIFPGQRLTDAQQMAFTTRFGPLETTIKSIGQERRLHENMVDLSNVDPKAEERLMGWNDRRMLYQSGNQLWHTDSSFKPVPAMASLLSGREVPPTGGETEYVSMRHAHATLPAGLQRRLEGRVVVHSILYSRSTIAKGLFDPEHEQELPPVRQALVRTNPFNGRKAIYIGSHAWYIEGVDDAESRRLLDDLLAHTTRPECVYQHRWTQWDLVMWDNRAVLHRGRPWDAERYRRIMRRTTLAGEGPTADPPYATRTPAWDGIIPEGVGV